MWSWCLVKFDSTRTHGEAALSSRGKDACAITRGAPPSANGLPESCWANLGDFKTVGAGVLELRIEFGPGYRIYCAEHGRAIVVLLCGGDKGSQRADIAKAKALWADYKRITGNA
jgi:putative addiction module killer protein